MFQLFVKSLVRMGAGASTVVFVSVELATPVPAASLTSMSARPTSITVIIPQDVSTCLDGTTAHVQRATPLLSPCIPLMLSLSAKVNQTYPSRNCNGNKNLCLLS